MKVLDIDSNLEVLDLYILFSQKEAKELSHCLKHLLENPRQKVATLEGEDLSGKLTKKIYIRIENKQMELNLNLLTNWNNLPTAATGSRK